MRGLSRLAHSAARSSLSGHRNEGLSQGDKAMTTAKPYNDPHERLMDDLSAADRSGTLKRPALAPGYTAPPLSVRVARSLDLLPRLLLAALLSISLATVLAQAHRYGVSIDEPLQQPYGERVLAWYTSLGKDTTFLTALPSGWHMPEHGGIFDAVIAALQSLFARTDPWLIRHIVTGLAGWLGIVAIGLCGYQLGGPWVAFVASLGLWLYPRYSGAMYNNPKDVPAAMAMTFVLWATLRLVKHWQQRARTLRSSALLGCCLGAATAIRIAALTWFAVLAVLLVGWWIVHGKSAWRERRVAAASVRHAVVAGTIAGSWLLSTMALWPFIFLSPFDHLIQSVQIMSHYPWKGSVLFDGGEYLAMRLPAGYVPTWLVIASPPMLLTLALLGWAIALVETARSRRINPTVGTVILAFVIPLASLLLLHPVLYGTLRQFLYIIPPLIVLAAYGLVRGVTLLLSQERVELRWLAAALVVVTVASYARVVGDMAALSPYEYAYFSPLAGGLRGASGNYETDYYATCSTAAAQWLSQNYRQYTDASSPTLDTPPLLGRPIASSLPTAFRKDTTYPDFFIGYTRDNYSLKYPAYRLIHVVAAQGVALCVVKANPTTTKNP